MFRFMTGSFRFLLRLFGGRRIGLRKAARRTGPPWPPFSGPSDRFLSRAEKTARWFCGLGRVAFGVDRQTRSWRHDAGKPVSGVGNRYGRKRGRIPAAAGFFISPRNATFTDRMPRRTLTRYAMSPKSFRVSRESPLLPFLLEACRSCSRTTVKSYLSHNQVEVNGRIVARFDHALSPGDEVAVFPGRRVEPLRHPMLRIVYEDEWLIVAAARTDPYGLLYPERARQAERPGQPDIRRPPAGPRHVGPVGVRQKRAGPVAYAEDMERSGPSPHLRGRRGGRVRQEERNRIDLFGRKQGI